MPCYQPSSLPSGVTTAGRTGYATEAECLAACKEGACCEGTTCSVKPQCQCKCQSGSCCGPDNATYGGVTKPRCRYESQASCAQRGGTWVPCGICEQAFSDPKSGVSDSWCTGLVGVNVPVFKGVGTVCTPNPCGYCACNSQIPANIGLAFANASITLTSGSGTVSEKASEIEDFIEQISPALTLQGSASQSATSFTYSAFGCSDANASGCVSCPPDFRAAEGGGGAGVAVASTLGLVIPCSGAIAASQWPFSTGQWRIEKPGSIFANYPCGQVRHLISMSFSTSPGSANLCSSPPASLSWVVAVQVRSSDFGTNGVPEANYTGTANVTATFSYPNPLP